jgi:peptide/nickel transport system permease protein
MSLQVILGRTKLSRRKLYLIGLAMVCSVLAITILAPWLATHHPTEYQDGARLQPPSREHLLGTDQLGRDIFSRLVYGGRVPVAVGLIATLVAMSLGSLFGWVSGYAGGYVDRAFSLTMDALYSFPSLVLAIVVAAMLGPGITNMVIAISIVYVPTYFRVARSQVLVLRERDFVEAARAVGANDATILLHHIAPNTLNSLLSISSFTVADAILTEAGLAFLGLGIAPPTPDWGFDLQNGQSFLPSGAWWPVTFPGLLILFLALGFGLLGEGLSDLLNPRRRANLSE